MSYGRSIYSYLNKRSQSLKLCCSWRTRASSPESPGPGWPGPPPSSTRRCLLCATEKYFIIEKPETASINKKHELYSHCHLLLTPHNTKEERERGEPKEWTEPRTFCFNFFFQTVIIKKYMLLHIGIHKFMIILFVFFLHRNIKLYCACTSQKNIYSMTKL